MASFDLRREVVVAKFQVLLDLISELDGNTDEIEAKLDAIITLLTSLDGKDFATETTLLALEATANSIESLLTSLNGKDFATETTLAALKVTADSILTSVQSIDAKVSTEAKQDTIILELQAIKGFVDGIEALLTSIDGKVATEVTLAAIKSQTDQFTFTNGELNVNAQFSGSVTTGPIEFKKDAVDTNVSLDTVTPANNEPLPTAIYNTKGLQGVKTNPFGISQYDDQTGSRQIVDLNGAAKVGESIILCGGVLYGQALSDFLWQTLSINGGTTFGNNGEQRLETGTTADGQIIIQSKKKSRFMISQFNINHFGVQLNPTDLLDPNTIWEWGSVTFLDDAGALNATPNGIFLRVTGGNPEPTWEIVNVKNGVENVVDSSLWNGVSAGNLNKTPALSVYEMQYNAGTAFFFQGSNFLHRIAGLTDTYAATYNFPVALRIRNINGNTNNRSFSSRAAGAYRLGEERGELIPRAFTADTLIKTGAGYVGKVSLSRTGSAGGSGNALIYDGVDATGVLIGRVDVGGDDVKGITLDGTFSNGLYITIAGSGTNTVTLNFE